MAADKKPYQTLGQHLKTVREQARRSLEEVSGAVEIEQTQLVSIENGVKRPDEEVMLLLISYFNMADQEALHLWELAKYNSELNEHLEIAVDSSDEQIVQNFMNNKPMVMLLSSMDVRTMYSDGVEVSWNQSGLTLNFTQTTKNQNMTISKVGMSHKQAETLLECLQRALLHVKYNGGNKMLPPPSSSDKETKK
jgi:transcriptional regulator with XRE-family HTH domain